MQTPQLGYIIHPSKPILKQTLQLKDPAPLCAVKTPRHSVSGDDMRSKQDHTKQQCAGKAYLKDPEPALDMKLKCNEKANLKDPEPVLDSNKVANATVTQKNTQGVQDLTIFLQNPDTSSPKSANYVGRKRTNAEVLVDKNDGKDDYTVKPAQKKARLTSISKKPYEAHNNRSKIMENKVEFPYGTVVSINGRNMHDARWADHNNSPTFIGIVQNPRHHDGREAESIDESCESMVTFALAGHYEWLDTELSNTMTGVFNDEFLNLISLPTNNDKKLKYRGEKDPMRNIDKENGKYVIRKHKNPCMGCGSPWCKFKKNRVTITNIVNNKKAEASHHSNKYKRHKCYVEIANEINEETYQGFRMRLGWCVENYVRSAFPKLPEEEYTGFKYGKNMCPSPAHSSDSETLYQK